MRVSPAVVIVCLLVAPLACTGEEVLSDAVSQADPSRAISATAPPSPQPTPGDLSGTTQSSAEPTAPALTAARPTLVEQATVEEIATQVAPRRLQVDPQTEGEALALLSNFVRLLRTDDKQGADDLWSGYPHADDARQEAFDYFLSEFSWIIEDRSLPEMYVVSTGWFGASAIPIVVLQSAVDRGRTAAFVVHGGSEAGIVRLPHPADDGISALTGSEYRPGQEVSVPGISVEGGVRAYLGEQEIRQVRVDHEALVTTVVLPLELTPGPVVLTLSRSTPESPVAETIVITIS